MLQCLSNHVRVETHLAEHKLGLAHLSLLLALSERVCLFLRLADWLDLLLAHVGKWASIALFADSLHIVDTNLLVLRIQVHVQTLFTVLAVATREVIAKLFHFGVLLDLLVQLVA